jgi:hypothetical protein
VKGKYLFAIFAFFRLRQAYGATGFAAILDFVFSWRLCGFA